MGDYSFFFTRNLCPKQLYSNSVFGSFLIFLSESRSGFINEK